jgi:methylated-DNA-[protein]-cysteine S-methyltransferase
VTAASHNQTCQPQHPLVGNHIKNSGEAGLRGGSVALGSVPTEVGDVLVAVTEVGVAATSFADTPRNRAWITGRLRLPVVDAPSRIAPALTELAAYFAGTRREFTVPVDWRLMSEAQQQVLGTLYHTVRYGQVITYGELARRSATRIPPRGIGTIMGSNPIPIIVPCHRVVAGDGLGGFSGGEGVESKRRLLTLEGHLPPTLF